MSDAPRYYLWKAVLGRTPKIELLHEEYRRILRAKEEIVHAINIEEEWDTLIQNYITFEKTLLSAALDSMVVRPTEHRAFSEIRLEFARAFSNFLATCRSYLDHTPHHLGGIGDGDGVEQFKSSTRTAYDGEFAYRFLEAMRNYAQHRGMPIHGTSFDSSWIGDRQNLAEDENAKLRHWVGATIDFPKVLKDKKFKASVAKEIPSDQKAIDVIEMTRLYLEALAKIHDEVRQSINEIITANLVFLRDQICRYGAVNDGDVLGLTAAEFYNDRKVATTDLFEDMLGWYEHLKARNGKLINLRKRYVTNEILDKRRFRRDA